MDMNYRGGDVGGRGWAGWSGVKGRKRENCNSIINKYVKKRKKEKNNVVEIKQNISVISVCSWMEVFQL